MNLTIASTGANDPHVHKAGCKDIARGLRNGTYQQGTMDLAAEDRWQVVAEWWSDIIEERMYEEITVGTDGQDTLSDWTAEQLRDLSGYVKFFPCCAGVLTVQLDEVAARVGAQLLQELTRKR